MHSIDSQNNEVFPLFLLLYCNRTLWKINNSFGSTYSVSLYQIEYLVETAQFATRGFEKNCDWKIFQLLTTLLIHLKPKYTIHLPMHT